MKFLAKSDKSAILAEAMTYKEGSTSKNRKLRVRLLAEQHGFCAYTERYVELHTVEVEHFTSSKKGHDDYYNYYAVIRDANARKMVRDDAFQDASIHENRFFQRAGGFEERIRFVDGGYEEIDPDDQEACDLITLLGLNDAKLFRARSKHVRRIRNWFDLAGLSEEEQLSYFTMDPEELSFITALEHDLGLDLEHLLGSTT